MTGVKESVNRVVSIFGAPEAPSLLPVSLGPSTRSAFRWAAPRFVWSGRDLDQLLVFTPLHGRPPEGT